VSKLVTSSTAKRVGKAVGKEALRVGANTVSDALAGENVGNALKKHLATTKGKVSKRLKKAADTGDVGALLPPTKKKGKKKKSRQPLF